MFQFIKSSKVVYETINVAFQLTCVAKVCDLTINQTLTLGCDQIVLLVRCDLCSPVTIIQTLTLGCDQIVLLVGCNLCGLVTFIQTLTLGPSLDLLQPLSRPLSQRLPSGLTPYGSPLHLGLTLFGLLLPSSLFLTPGSLFVTALGDSITMILTFNSNIDSRV